MEANRLLYNIFQSAIHASFPSWKEGYSKPSNWTELTGRDNVTALWGVVEVMGINHPAPILMKFAPEIITAGPGPGHPSFQEGKLAYLLTSDFKSEKLENLPEPADNFPGLDSFAEIKRVCREN